MEKRWYVVQSKSKQEAIVQENLENQNFIVFFPQCIERKLSRGKPVIGRIPMFPSYLFVQFDISSDRWRAICSTRGVFQLLTATEEHITPLPHGFVEELSKRTDENGYLNLEDAEIVLENYAVGDQIKIKSGVFSGLSGTCARIGRNSVVVLLSLLSGERQIEFSKKLISGVPSGHDVRR